MYEGMAKQGQMARRPSFRKHRQRLTDIRQNVTAKEFYLNAHPRPQDKKGILLNKMKEETIKYENSVLKNKIQTINCRNSPINDLPQGFSRTEQVRNGLARYDALDDEKLDLREDFEEGEPVRCIVPGKKRALSFVSHAKPQIKLQSTSYHTSKSRGRRQKRPQSFHRTHIIERQFPFASSSSKQIQNQKYFQFPQRNEERHVIHNKTIILSPTQTCLYQISLIGNRMLITAHIVGIQGKETLTELLSQKKTKNILRECQNNCEELYQKIYLQRVEGSKKIKAIKIRDHKERLESEEKQKKAEEDKNKLKAHITQDFIKRNYYDTLKKDEDGPSIHNKPKTSADSLQKIQQMLQRLAVPKKYLLKDPILSEQTAASHMLPKPPSKVKQQATMISIHIDTKSRQDRNKNQRERLLEQQTTEPKPQPENKQSLERPKMSKAKIKPTESIIYDKSQSKTSEVRPVENQTQVLQSDIIKPKKQEVAHLEPKKPGSDEQEVEYLDGDLDEYDEQSQNPSGVNNQSKHENKPAAQSAQGVSPIEENDSHVSEKSKNKLAAQIQKNQSNQYENIYEEDEYQNEDYEQVFEENSPVYSKKGVSKAGKNTIKNNSSVVQQQKIQQEYPEQFQN